MSHDFNFGKTNVHTKYKINNLKIKYNTNFNIEVTNVYNLNIFIANINTNCDFFRNLGWRSPLVIAKWTDSVLVDCSELLSDHLN